MKHLIFASLGAVAYSQECLPAEAQCAGEEGDFTGQSCCEGLACNFYTPYFSSCGVPWDNFKGSYEQCGGTGYTGETFCARADEFCKPLSDDFHACFPISPGEERLENLDCAAETVGEEADADIPNRSSRGFFDDHGALSVDGVNLVDESGERVQLHGLNLGGFFEENCATASAIAFVVDNWDVNLIRVVVEPWQLVDENNTYSLEAEANYSGAIATLAEIVDDLGVYLMISYNAGGRIASDFLPGEANEFYNYVGWWNLMGTQYAGNDHVIFNILHEPAFPELFDDQTLWADIRGFSNQFVPQLRDTGFQGVVVVGTPWYSQHLDAPYVQPVNENITTNLMWEFAPVAGAHLHRMEAYLLYATKVPYFISKTAPTYWDGTGMYIQAGQQIMDVFNSYGASYTMNYFNDEGNPYGSLFREDACLAENFRDLSCLGKFTKRMLINGEYGEPDGQCVANVGAQCAGVRYVGRKSCCGDLVCSYVNVTASECREREISDPVGLQAFEECSLDATTRDEACEIGSTCTSLVDGVYAHCVPDEETPSVVNTDTFTALAPRISAAGFADEHGRLTKSWWRLRGVNGEEVQLRGVSTDLITEAGNCYTEASLMNLVENFGVNAIRIKMPVAASQNGLESNPEIVAEVDRLVNMAVDAGIYAVISFVVDGDVTPYQDLGYDFWVEMTQKYIENDNLIFELESGVTLGSNVAGSSDLEGWESSKPFNYRVKDFIQQTDPTRVMFIGHGADGKDFYMNYWSHLHNRNNVAGSAKFNMATDSHLLGRFREHINSIALVFSELSFADTDGAIYIGTTQKVLRQLNEYKVSFFLAGWGDNAEGGIYEAGECANGNPSSFTPEGGFGLSALATIAAAEERAAESAGNVYGSLVALVTGAMFALFAAN